MNSLKRNPDCIDDVGDMSSAQLKHAKRLDTFPQAHQNTAALRQRLTTPVQQQSSSVAENDNSPGGLAITRPVQSIRELGKHMDELRHESARYAEATRALETQISESEAACGRMLQRYLELGRAIALRERQIRDDKESLLQAQQMKESKGRELDVVLTKISNLVSGVENAS